MRKTMLAAILAVSALVPAAALAQDGGHWHGRGGNGGDGYHGGGSGSGGNRQFQPRPDSQPRPSFQPRQVERAPQPAQVDRPQFRQQPQGGGRFLQPQPQFRRGERNADGSGFAGTRPNVDRFNGNRPNGGGFDGNRRAGGGFAGNRGGGYGYPNGGGYNGDRFGRGPKPDGDRGRFAYQRGYQGGYQQRGGQFRNDRGPGYYRGGGYNPRGGYNGRGYAGNWNRDWRRDRRYDYGSYRTNNRYAFHLPRYYAPYGWNYGYRRLSIGFVLSDILFEQSYWIDDPYEYRLPPVDGEYRWVRYYNDALLVDIETGEVVDTVYDIFW